MFIIAVLYNEFSKSRGDSSFEDIMKRIATKGGTTEAGINCLKQELITETCRECVNAAYHKSKNIL